MQSNIPMPFARVGQAADQLTARAAACLCSVYVLPCACSSTCTCTAWQGWLKLMEYEQLQQTHL
jgi:hypothetical protein